MYIWKYSVGCAVFYVLSLSSYWKYKRWLLIIEMGIKTIEIYDIMIYYIVKYQINCISYLNKNRAKMMRVLRALFIDLS